LSRSITLKGYGSTQDIIDGPHCFRRKDVLNLLHH
jgi:hypothetical protein